MKILIVTETFPPQMDGASRFSRQLALGMIKKGHKVEVVTPGFGLKNKIEKKDGVTIVWLKTIKIKPIHPYFRFVIPFNLKRQLEAIISKFRPDIIHIQNHFFLGQAAIKVARSENIPIIGTNHFMPENLLEYVPNFISLPIMNLMWKHFVTVYDQLDYVTVPSYAAARLVKKVGLKAKIKVISNGIDLRSFKPIKIDPKILTKFNLKPGRPTFIFVGRLAREKNIDFLLKASQIVQKKVQIQVVIVGSGKDETYLKRLTNKLQLSGTVFFTGNISDKDLRLLLNLADVYVAPGSAELQGIAVMEAMASSLPILALDAVALPELVKKGVNGWLFKFSSQDLAKKMLKIIAEPSKLKEMGRQSLALVKKHNRPRIIAKFEDLYLKVINDNSSPAKN